MPLRTDDYMCARLELGKTGPGRLGDTGQRQAVVQSHQARGLESRCELARGEGSAGRARQGAEASTTREAGS